MNISLWNKWPEHQALISLTWLDSKHRTRREIRNWAEDEEEEHLSTYRYTGRGDIFSQRFEEVIHLQVRWRGICLPIQICDNTKCDKAATRKTHFGFQFGSDFLYLSLYDLKREDYREQSLMFWDTKSSKLLKNCIKEETSSTDDDDVERSCMQITLWRQRVRKSRSPSSLQKHQLGEGERRWWWWWEK